MAKFPCTQTRGARATCRLLNDTVFRLAELVKATLRKNVEGEGQPCQPICKNPVVNVAACGVVACQGGGTLPRLTPASSILVVAVGECLMADEPKTLEEKKR